MKKVLLLTSAAMVIASAAFAQGMNMYWDDCSFLGNVNRDNACASNGGIPNKLVISVDPVGVINDVNGAQGIVDVLVEDANLPPYWELMAGGCRAGRLASDVNIGNSSAPFTCLEAWSQVGNTAGGAAFIPYVGGPNRGRFNWQVAVPGTVVMNGPVDGELYLIALIMTNGSTTTCAGCLTPACLVLNEVRLTKPAGTSGGDVFITTPAQNQHVTWQGGGSIDCPGATPTQSQTWGQVKSLYR